MALRVSRSSGTLTLLCALTVAGCAARSSRPAPPPSARTTSVPSAQTALQREIERAYVDFLTKLRALAGEKDITRAKFIEVLRTVGARVPAQLSDEEFARAKQMLPMLIAMYDDIKGLQLIKLVNKGDRAGYIFQPKKDEPGQLTVGIIKLARASTPSKWRVIKVYSTSLERRKELSVEQQVTRILASEEAFQTLYDEIELEPLQERADWPTARFEARWGKRLLRVLLNGVELRLGGTGSSRGHLLAAEAQRETPLAADPLFRGLFALRWGKNELKLIYGPGQSGLPIEFSLMPRGYELPAVYATTRGEQAGEISREFTIERTAPQPHFPAVVSSLPDKSYGVFFVEGRLARISFKVNGESSGMSLVGVDGISLVDGLKPGRNKVEIIHSLVEIIPPALAQAPRQARLIAVLPGLEQVLTLPLSKKERSKAFTVNIK